MKTFSLTCFGTGDGWPCTDRNHAAFLYRLGQTSILVDCGEPIDRSYKASGLSYNLFDAIFLSHLHADHVGGFFMLLQGCWLEKRRRDLPVYLPKGGVRPLGGFLRAAFLSNDVLPFRLDLRPLQAGKPVRVRDARVSSFPTSHLNGFKRKMPKPRRSGLDAHCFLIESAGRRVGHSADLGAPEDLEPLLAKPLDLLVCEMAHFSPERIFRYLNGRDIRRVVFIHLARRFRKNLAATRRLAAKMLPGLPHTFAGDGEEIRF